MSITRDFKVELANIAGLDVKNIDKWDVFDSDDDIGLYLIHSIVDPKYPNLPRGKVIDIKYGLVVCDSFGFSPVVLDSEDTFFVKPIPSSDDQEIKVIDEYVQEHRFLTNKSKIVPSYEGVVVRVFKHENKIYYSTHKRLDCSKSWWGDSKRFLEIYQELGGPKPEILFPENVRSSPWCYQFLLVNSALLIATAQDIGKGYIVNLGALKMWDYDTIFSSGFDAGEKHVQPTDIPSLTDTIYFEGSKEEGKTLIVKPPELTLDQAKTFINEGYDGSHGEAILIYNLDENGRVMDAVKIHNKNFHDRVLLRNENPNIRHRFFQLMDDVVLNDKNIMELIRRYPLFYQRQSSDKNAWIVYVDNFGSETQLNLSNVDDRVFLMFCHFYEALPLSLRQKYIGLYNEYKRDKYRLIEALQHLSFKINRKNEDIDVNSFSIRVQQLLKASEEYADKKLRNPKGQVFNKAGKRLGRQGIIHRSLYFYIQRERGYNLFKLIREMKKTEYFTQPITS